MIEFDYICTGCLSNESLKDYVVKHQEKRLHECPICHKKNHPAISCDKFAEYILTCIDHNYSSVEEMDGIDYDSDSSTFFYVDTNCPVNFTNICDILNENYIFHKSVIEYELLPQIYEAIINSYNPDRNIYSDLSETGWTHAKSEDLHFSWKSFNYLVQNNNRFFEFNNCSRLKYLEKIMTLFDKFEDELIEGTPLYRIRKSTNVSIDLLEDHNTILKEIGPPPCCYTNSYRMSPKGISYLYVSSDIKTCIKECGIRLNDEVLIGIFTNTHSLKILNLETKELPYYDLFSGQFDREQENIWKFIKDYTSKISQPVLKGNDFEYLPTQVIAEYIRQQGYDGIAYSSAKTGKTNYVFFYGPDYYSYPNIRPKGWNAYIDSVPSFTNVFTLDQCILGKITNSRKGSYDIIKSIT